MAKHSKGRLTHPIRKLAPVSSDRYCPTESCISGKTGTLFIESQSGGLTYPTLRMDMMSLRIMTCYQFTVKYTLLSVHKKICMWLQKGSNETLTLI